MLDIKTPVGTHVTRDDGKFGILRKIWKDSNGDIRVSVDLGVRVVRNDDAAKYEKKV